MNDRHPRVAWETGGPADVNARWQALRDDRDAPHVHATAAGFFAWAAHFAPPDRLPLLRLGAGDAVDAYLPAVHARSQAGSIWPRVLRSPGNHYWSCGYPIVGVDGTGRLDELMRALRGAKFWDVLELGPIAQGDDADQLTSIAAEQALSPVILRRSTDHGVTIAGEWSQYYAGRSAKLRKQISSGERALGVLGPVTFEEWSAGPDLETRLEEFFHLEASGWKGREHTAILSDPRTHRFYRDLALRMSEHGWFRLHLLRADGRCVAGEYSLSFNGTLSLLKPGYDESLAKASPGHLLRARVIQHLLSTRDHHTYSLGTLQGSHMAYKERWCNTSREYLRLRLFNPSTVRGRVAKMLLDVKRRRTPTTRSSGSDVVP